MGRNIYLLFVILFMLIADNSTAQNYFPLAIGNKYQIRYDHFDEFFNEGYTTYDTKYIINDSIVYNGETFYKYNIHYFMFDSVQQKLFIYSSNFGKQLAADFNLQQYGNVFISYIQGYPDTALCYGVQYINVFGQNRLRWQMTTENGEWPFITKYTYNFVDGVGMYGYHKVLPGIEPPYYHDYDDYTYYAAIIGSQIYNQMDLNIQLASPLHDTRLNDFPINVSLNIYMPVLQLLDSLYLNYSVIRDTAVIYNDRVNFDRTNYYAMINPSPLILSVGDKIKIKIVATDNTIFENLAELPDTGYYFINVIPDTTTAINLTSVNGFDFQLEQNYPNPFNPATNIAYTIPHPGIVTLKVYDDLGNEIKTLVNEEKSAGRYNISFDGSSLASGIYFYVLRAGDFVQSRKMLLLK